MRVAAVAPSGPVLARLITREIMPDVGPVLELGPGTGVFTRALLARGVPESHLTLIEFGPEFARLLAERFPQARVVSIDAARIVEAGLSRQDRSALRGERPATAFHAAGQGREQSSPALSPR